jgi:predicted 3-demethylubiquinone-9 3-methyltransferase (glyoxalase superfamily)
MIEPPRCRAPVQTVRFPMPQINTFLTFNTQAEDAARFYTSIFPNSKITRVTRYPDLGPQAPFKAGGVMTVEFTLDGRAFTALNGGPQFTFTQGISINVLCDTQQQVDEYWGKFIAAGGTPIACGWLTDHFGVSWQIDPKVLIEMIADPDPVKAGKAMRAMMTMVKIDGEQIKRAVAE